MGRDRTFQRRVVLFGALLLALVGSPAADAQSALPILNTQLHVTYHVDVGQLLVNPDLNQTAADALTSGGPNAEVCGTDHLETFPDEQRFRFSESAQQTGCAEYGYVFEPTPRAASFRLVFAADRVVATSGELAQTPIDAEQSVRLRGSDELIIDDRRYFDSTLPTQPARLHALLFDVPPASERLNVTWFFSDHGYSPVQTPFSIGSGHAFSANVTAPRIEFSPIPLGRGVLTERTHHEADGTNTTTSLYAIDVPDRRRDQRDTGVFHFSIDPNVNFSGLHTPNGNRIDPETYHVNTTRERVLYILDDAALDTHGRGLYLLAFTTTAQLPPPAPAPPPDTIYPLAWLLLLLPALTGAVAVREGLVFRKKATEPFVHAARNILLALGLVASIYVLLLIYSLVFGQIRIIATLPFGVEAWILALQLVLVSLVFLFLAIYPGRYLITAMQQDLARRVRMQAELERSNRELEQFAYVASHDLQEPLRTVSGYAQLLQRRYAPQLDEKGHHYIDRTVAGTARMQHLIQDLLTYSRIQTRGQEFEATDMDAVVRRVQDDLARVVAESHARIEAEPLPTVRGDPVQLEQVVSNLVRNAIRYAHPDRKPHIRIGGRDEGDWWHFTVADNGVGIAPEHQERVFLLFQRLRPRDRDDEGTGIGLAIAQRIVERHGGHIWVDSAPDRGSTFHFTIAK